MAYKIIEDECISCGACEATCPKGAISQGDNAYMIDPAVCEECGDCVEACPQSAIVKA